MGNHKNLQIIFEIHLYEFSLMQFSCQLEDQISFK